MKKFISCLLVVLLIIPSTVALAADGYDVDEKVVTKADATEFADDLKALDGEVSDRLIVSTDKKIDFMGASGVADGIEGLYVLQYDTFAEAKKAEQYYNSLSYINYVEYDIEQKHAVCSEETTADIAPLCVSTVNSNIDDAMKLLRRENYAASDMKIAVIDTGVCDTAFTHDRLVSGGYSYIDGLSSDGTEDVYGHGTKVAGTIILNTPENVKIATYQIFDSNASGTASSAISAIYLSVADGCKILNCSFKFEVQGATEKSAFEAAIDYADENGVFIICSSGNNSLCIDTYVLYPTMSDRTITVGAVEPDNQKASFSNWGKCIDIYATGTSMITYDTNGKLYTNWRGTSAACPVVSSACAIMISACPDITFDELRTLLVSTGAALNDDNKNAPYEITLDAYAALCELTGKSLERVNLDYEINKNESTLRSDISFSADSGAEIYYFTSTDTKIYMPYNDTVTSNYSKYNGSDEINLESDMIVTACAYAPDKAKSKLQIFQAPDYYDDCGYWIDDENADSSMMLWNLTDATVDLSDVEFKKVGEFCFAGNKYIETVILPESVKQIDYFAFANCPNLKTVIAPGVEACGRYAFYQCDSLVNVEMPNVTVANTGMFKNCHKLETAKLGVLTEIDNHAFYGCENLKLVKTTSDDISFAERTFYNCNELTISTPSGSAMETFANENDIDLLGDVEKVGGSIRATDAGMRLGFKYVGENNPHIEEYGFVYSYSKTDDLTVDNAKIKSADNRIDHGEYTTYNLVFTSVPSTEYETDVSARAYIKIGGEYFYSDVLQRNYLQIANAVLADDEIDENTKSAVRNIISTEV